MNAFLSEEEILKHKEYLRQLKLKYSILEKSIPGIENKDFRDISRMLRTDEREEVLKLLSKIRLHELYFSSFSDTPMKKNSFVSEQFGSEANFLYNLFKICKNAYPSFLCITVRKGRIFPVLTEDFFSLNTPLLAIDLYEHAYFGDYGFNREKYLESALSYLDLDRIKV